MMIQLHACIYAFAGTFYMGALYLICMSAPLLCFIMICALSSSSCTCTISVSVSNHKRLEKLIVSNLFNLFWSFGQTHKGQKLKPDEQT